MQAGRAVPHSWFALVRLTPSRCVFKHHGQSKPAGWLSSSIKRDTHLVTSVSKMSSFLQPTNLLT